MDAYLGQVLEVRLAADGSQQAVVDCPVQAVPAPGQYVQAHALQEVDSPLPRSLFLGGKVSKHGKKATFLAAAPTPPGWHPGDELLLRGPFGHGFDVPPTAKRLALVALGENISRLLPLTILAGIENSLFCDAPIPQLPMQVEVNPLSDLGRAWKWADLMLFDGPASAYQDLTSVLGIASDQPFPCPAQALVYTPMPCGGMAECGICAVRGSGRKVLLACEDGPVFRLDGRGLHKM